MDPIDEYELLKRMHNYGVVSRNNAKTLPELAAITSVDEATLKDLLAKLVEYNYVHSVESDHEVRYYVTGPGIITVCSFFT